MFTTPITLPPSALSLTPTSHALMLGSCFADEIGTRLASSLPEGNVDVNPFGVLYNPASIALALRMLISTEPAEDVVRPYIFQGQDGLFHSWAHSTHFSDTTFEGCLTKCATRLTSARQLLVQSDLLIITLGTDRAYRHNGEIVANCHKEPSKLFSEEDTVSLNDIEQCKGEFPSILRLVAELYPTLNIVLTVSPYRYKKYGFHESQLSKARLLLLCDAIIQQKLHITYFPAYEILLDELRDYRFYADDMLHPSQVAVNHIWQLFQQWAFTPELTTFAQLRQKELRRERHRPINKDC